MNYFQLLKLNKIRIFVLYLLFLVILISTSLFFTSVNSQALHTSDKIVDSNSSYMQPVQGLSYEQLKKFKAGEKQFLSPWVPFPSLGGEWGLGPTFLANSCVACHVQGGRGRTNDVGDAVVFQQLLRLSLSSEGLDGRPKPHPHYGDQLQVFAINVSQHESFKPNEALLLVEWMTEIVMLEDGTEVELRKPKIRIQNPNFGEIGSEVMTSLRNTQALVGMGYLDAVSEADILAIAKSQQALGLRGRPNYVRDDIKKRTSLGRFGWKANQPSIRQQLAKAFHGDMGVTSSLYSEENCPEIQKACRALLPASKPELSNKAWNDLTFWAIATDVPTPRNSDSDIFKQGKKLFEQANCHSCHLPELKTSTYPLLPQIANKSFHAYTDMLLHDMGDNLADGRPDFKAGPRDWRTAPLWGLGLSAQVNGSTNLLHDGRARNVLEAILWHAGEAKKSRDIFSTFRKEDRDALIEFVNSI